jgi:DNA-binding transcriptional LysR family regulator
MRWRLDDMIAFLHVVETGSITAAARQLGLTKSVVSKRVADLEEALGQELLRRAPRRMLPTDAGRALHARMRPLLHEIDALVEEVAETGGPLRGRLRIAMPMSFGTLYLAPMLLRFARAHRELELALDLDDRAVDLLDGGYDLAIRVGSFADSSVVARKLCGGRRVLVCSPVYAAERGTPATLDDLARHDCIDYANVQSSRLWQFDAARGGRVRAVAIASRLVANNGEVMRDAAIAGLGLALLPDFLAADGLARGRLVEVTLDAKPLPYEIAALYAPTRHVPRKVRDLVDHLVREFRQTPPWRRS